MPGQIGVNAGGANIVRPSVTVSIDATAMEPNRPNSMGVVGVLGTADGGAPGTVYEFRSFSEAQAVLRGGAVLSYLQRIFRPSPDATVPGAGLVRFVRIGAPTQATGTPLAGMTFTSVDYGRHTNGISVQIAVGSSNAWDVTVRKRLDGVSRIFSVGNGLSVTSSATTPKVVFDHAAKQVKMYENALVVATLDYPTDSVTLSNVSAFIQARAGWTCLVTGDPSMPVRYMDNPILAAAPAITAVATALPASQGALIWLLSKSGFLVTADVVATGTYATLSVVAETYLSGATGTSADTMVGSDWTAGLTKLSAVDVQFVFLATTDTTAQALAYQHVLDMRTVLKKRYRILFLGGPVAQTSAQAIAAAPLYDGPCVYVWNGTVASNPLTGLQEQLGGHGSAAQVLGVTAGSYASDPATGKSLLSLGLEVPNPTDTEITNLLIAGVTPITLDVVTGRSKVEQAITTWQGGANVAYRKLLGLRIQDEISRGFQRVLAGFIGDPLDLVTGNLIKLSTAKFLDGSIRTAQNPGGFLTPGFQYGAELPAWENLAIVGDGMELWDISVTVHPVGETDYIRVAVKLAPVQIAL